MSLLVDCKSMEYYRMQANYRTIFTEMLLAQSAAAGAFADATGRYAQLMGQAYQEALLTLAAETQPKGGAAGPAHPVDGARISGASRPGLADLCRDFAGLPRFSMMEFLSRYDNLRGRRAMVRD
ncbi:hypothetical protein KIP88_02365 [Bradyrhizobium sp. SRL28]|uniref:hypothetical protein n=1 Tax=Bradyrhizobium sp. SRL28 TaxID=2836178 RepID=UPI001BDF6F99|nr:hypothetical protein [Bradyrhizobium sp. SRL28]MBT1509333.1 hypothetical protein [Bradyrhizobium sp. SRL28]